MNDEIRDDVMNNAEETKKKEHQEAVKQAINQYIREREAKLKAEQKAEQSERERHKTHFTGQPFALTCREWEATDTGVAKVDEKGRRFVACPHPVMPVERLINLDSGTEKLKIAFQRDGAWKEIIVDCTVCNNRQNILTLANYGVMVTSENAKYLVQYLFDMQAENQTIPVSRSTSRLGWQGKTFVPYNGDIQFDGGGEFAQLMKAVHTKGDRDTYMASVKELRKNKTVRLIMAASLASILLEKVGAQPFIVHIWGPTGVGKTVALKLAASIWGDGANGALVRSMNTTINALMQNAGVLYNLPLLADEMQQIKRQNGTYDKLIMCFTEGIDRSRARANGGIEALKTWHNCMISTGEEPLTRENSGGGAKNRVIELEVTADLFASGYEVASFLETHYGWLGKEFAEDVAIYTAPHLKALYRLKVEEVLALGRTTDKQAAAMGAILLADALASQEFFAGEPPLGAADVAEYLSGSDSVDIAERAFEYLSGVIAANQNRFVASENHGEIWGRMYDGYAMINKTILERILREGGFEYDAVSRRWAEREYILKASDGAYRHRTSIYGVRTSYVKVNLDIEKNGIGQLVDAVPPVEFLQEDTQLKFPA